MSEGCVNCWVKDKDKAKEKLLNEAIAHADKTGEPLAIYREGNEWKYLNAFTASALGIPYIQVVSSYNRVTPT